MHELSIAMSIVEMAEEEMERRGAGIIAVHLKIGPLSGVVRRALEPAYEMACEGTPLEGSRLVIRETSVIVFCPTCRDRRVLATIQLFQCPECGTGVSEILEGKELEVVALELAE